MVNPGRPEKLDTGDKRLVGRRSNVTPGLAIPGEQLLRYPLAQKWYRLGDLEVNGSSLIKLDQAFMTAKPAKTGVAKTGGRSRFLTENRGQIPVSYTWKSSTALVVMPYQVAMYRVSGLSGSGHYQLRGAQMPR
jgi:hypothetical protein